MRNPGFGLLFVVLLAGSAFGRDSMCEQPCGGRRTHGPPAADPAGRQRTGSHDRQGPPPGRPGDQINLIATGQPYRECVSLAGSRLSGTAREPFVLNGNGAALDGSLPIAAQQWKFYRDNTYRFRPPHTEFYQLFLDGKPAERVFVPGPPRRQPAEADSPP